MLADEPLCRECGRLAAQVDHIIELSDGGDPFDRNNLQPLCLTCHERKTRESKRTRRTGDR